MSDYRDEYDSDATRSWDARGNSRDDRTRRMSEQGSFYDPNATQSEEWSRQGSRGEYPYRDVDSQRPYRRDDSRDYRQPTEPDAIAQRQQRDQTGSGSGSGGRGGWAVWGPICAVLAAIFLVAALWSHFSGGSSSKPGSVSTGTGSNGKQTVTSTAPPSTTTSTVTSTKDGQDKTQTSTATSTTTATQTQTSTTTVTQDASPTK